LNQLDHRIADRTSGLGRKEASTGLILVNETFTCPDKVSP